MTDQRKVKLNFVKDFFANYQRKKRYNTKKELYTAISQLWYSKTHDYWDEDAIRKYINKYFPVTAKIKMNTKGKVNTASNSFEEKYNEATGIANSKESPYAIEEIQKLFKIDISVWKADRIRVNSWDVTNKYGVTYTNYQTRVDFIRIIPLVITIPPIKNVLPPKPVDFTRLRIVQDVNTALILGDSQNGYRKDLLTGKLTPYHDRTAWSVALSMAKTVRPEVVVFLGDMLDLPSWSDKFLKSPEFYFTTQPTLIELHWWLSRFRLELPNADIYYLEGNHEKRLVTATINHLLEAYNLRPADCLGEIPAMSVQSLLGLKSLDIKYIEGYPKGSMWLNDNLEVYHGNIVRQRSGDTAKTILQDARSSKIVGHGHRMESAYKTVYSRNKTIAYGVHMCGVLSKTDGTVPSNARSENWQQGAILVDYTDGNGLFDINSVSINDGTALCRGEFLVSEKERDIVKMLNEGIKNEFKF